MSHEGSYPVQTFAAPVRPFSLALIPAINPAEEVGAVGQPQEPQRSSAFDPYRPHEPVRGTERALFHAYRHTRRGCVCCAPEPERCACGGVIAPESVRAIEDAVRRHNETSAHREWRALRETAG